MTQLSNEAGGATQSLMLRNLYGICYPQRDTMEYLHSELTQARKKFFSGKKRAVRVGNKDLQHVFEGKLTGKMTRHSLYWKKTSARMVLEEAFDQPNGYVLVKKDFRGVTVSRTFFDRNHFWVKSEYYEPWNPARAQVIFKPQPTSDLIDRFDWDNATERYQATELHPLPYHAGTAEQSLLSARFGEPTLLISTEEGEFCYCTKHEAQERLKAQSDIQDGTIVLMPAWEVKNGALTGEEPESESNITFTSLEEYAKIEPNRPQEALSPASHIAAPQFTGDTMEFTLPPVEATTPAEQQKPAAAKPKTSEEEILEAARRLQKKPRPQKKKPAAKPTPAVKAPAEETTPAVTQAMVAAYHGGYADGKREGFGSYYYKDGTLCYAGGWKNDKKEGLGVSFRSSDHALHITNWNDGKPGDVVTLFDQNGNLRYSGKMQDGKKQGAGVTINREDGTIFVGKWENGKPTGMGSSFDNDGNLLYYGGWKDGLRDGHGTEFDRNGGIVYDGEWKDGKYHNGILYQKLSATPEDEPGDVFDQTDL